MFGDEQAHFAFGLARWMLLDDSERAERVVYQADRKVDSTSIITTEKALGPTMPASRLGVAESTPLSARHFDVWQCAGIYTLRSGEPYQTPERIEHRIDRDATEYYEWRVDRIPLPEGGFGVVCYFRDISD